MRARFSVNHAIRRAGAVITAAIVAPVVAVAASGCGSRAAVSPAATAASATAGGGTNGLQNQTPDQVVRNAVAALRAARSFQIVMTPPPGAGGPFEVADLQVEGGAGIATLVKNGRALFKVAVVGKKAYIQFSREMLQQLRLPGLFKQLAAGRWVRMHADQAPPEILGDPVAFLAARLTHHGPLEPAVRQATLHGQKVVVVTDGRNGAKLYVANTGRAYPLLVTWPNGHRIELTRYGASFDIPTPANTLPDGTTYTGPSLI